MTRGVVIRGHDPSIWEVGAWGNLKFKASLGYIVSSRSV